MKVIDDGIIKYDRTNFSHSGPLNELEFSELENWRKILYKLELIGEYPIVNIGFGNMSERKNYTSLLDTNSSQFVITGTQTGKYKDLNGFHYTRVLKTDIENLKVHMQGCIEASSEAVTHAAIYESNPNIKAVFHIHHKIIWEKMIEDKSDFTPVHIPYGTLEMARATQHCINGKDFGVFCMHGHEDGVVIYARSLDEAGRLTHELYNRYALNH